MYVCTTQGCSIYRTFDHFVSSQAGLATCHSKRMAKTENLLSQPLPQGIAIAWHA